MNGGTIFTIGRAWDSLLVRKSGCAEGRGFVPQSGQ